MLTGPVSMKSLLSMGSSPRRSLTDQPGFQSINAFEDDLNPPLRTPLCPNPSTPYTGPCIPSPVVQGAGFEVSIHPSGAPWRDPACLPKSVGCTFASVDFVTGCCGGQSNEQYAHLASSCCVVPFFFDAVPFFLFTIQTNILSTSVCCYHRVTRGGWGGREGTSGSIERATKARLAAQPPFGFHLDGVPHSLTFTPWHQCNDYYIHNK
jgi:hypothetical protein